MNIYIATNNAHKSQEFARMFELAGIPCIVKSAREIGGMPECEENGKTFADNAFIKAEALYSIAPQGSYVMADDSGICVDFLHGAPGVHSARYSGVSGPLADKANNDKLLAALSDVPNSERTARFVCEIALICPDGRRRIFGGKIEGIINRAETGNGGFGYDPLFYVPSLGMTTAEIPADQKNTISHRGMAFKKLTEFLKNE